MRLSDLPWRDYIPQFVGDDSKFAELRLADGRVLRFWMPGSKGCEVEFGIDGGPHEYLTRLEARCRLIEAITEAGKPLPNTTTTSSNN